MDLENEVDIEKNFYFDRQGNPIKLMDWAEKFMDSSYKIIKSTVIDNYHISTVWLGLDHSFFDGEKLIFETMIFDKYIQFINYQERYSTEQQAIEGHSRAEQFIQDMM